MRRDSSLWMTRVDRLRETRRNALSSLSIASNVAKPAAPEYRQAPFDIEAEQALLGAILVNNDAYERVSSFLEPQHFHEALHQRIFEACARLIRKNQLASPVTLRPHFQ